MEVRLNCSCPSFQTQSHASWDMLDLRRSLMTSPVSLTLVSVSWLFLELPRGGQVYRFLTASIVRNLPHRHSHCSRHSIRLPRFRPVAVALSHSFQTFPKSSNCITEVQDDSDPMHFQSIGNHQTTYESICRPYRNGDASLQLQFEVRNRSNPPRCSKTFKILDPHAVLVHNANVEEEQRVR